MVVLLPLLPRLLPKIKNSVQPLFSQYNILYFATPAAVVPGDASQALILFGDGKAAPLHDIESWMLNNIALVVLSACETELGGFNNGQCRRLRRARGEKSA